MTIFRYIVYHITKRLGMSDTVMIIQKINTLKTAQIVISLPHRKGMTTGKFLHEYNDIFYLISDSKVQNRLLSFLVEQRFIRSKDNAFTCMRKAFASFFTYKYQST